MTLCIFFTTQSAAPAILAMIPPGVTTESCATPAGTMRAAVEYLVANGGTTTIVATADELAAMGSHRSIHFAEPRKIATFLDMVPPEIWKAEALTLLRQAAFDYAIAAKYDKAHACAVLAGIKSPLVHELERIAELKQLEKPR